LEVSDLGHRYGSATTGATVLRSLDFVVNHGEIVSLVGPSGCGKSTLLRCVSGLMAPTSGRVLLDGVEVRAVPPTLAMVFQDYSRSLYPWMSVARNVEFPLLDAGVAKAERRSRVAECLDAVGLRGQGDKLPWQMSGGMQQRAAIARAIAYRPEILLMDEPFASVDAQTRSDLEDLVQTVRDRFAMTILFVTHDIDESVYLSDRVVVLSATPTIVQEQVAIALPAARDQISTRGLPEFVRARTRIAELISRAVAGRATHPDLEETTR
jgi:NitT/TauT family transport system ATP-binding protein